MAYVKSLSEFHSGPTAVRFEGHAAGAPVSFFVTDTPPGKGPGLHIHPYPEVFVVEEGEATFTAGDEQVVVTGGHVVVVPAETWHGFKNSGEETLHIVSIHPSGEIVQTWLDESDGP
jgi:mannose-6-phosphate isomerase-like protein (cupin superfamily)